MAGFHKVVGSGPTDQRSRNDYYPTNPVFLFPLLNVETFEGPVLEPCAGAGHLVRGLESRGYAVLSNEPYPQGCFETDERSDFLSWVDARGCRSLVTNPPYRHAEAFVKKAIELRIKKHAWLLRFQFLESARRYPLFRDHPPARLYVFTRRIQVSKRGLIDPIGGMIVYAWWVWDKKHRGPTKLHWFPPDVVEPGPGR